MAENDSEALEPGSVVGGRFEIIGKIRSEDDFDIYQARQTIVERLLALKVMRKDSSQNLHSFQKEAKHLSMVAHPNVAAVYDFGLTENNVPYMVMEYLEGESLHDILEREEVLTLERTRQLFSQVCDGMYAFHQKHIAHRALSPYALFVSRDENGAEKVTITNFTDSVLYTAEVDTDGPEPEIVGSADTISPEQLKGMRLDGRTDIYAIGCALYQCLSGKPPFEGETLQERVMKHLTDPPPQLTGEGLASVQSVIEKCLAKDPEDRFADGMSLKSALIGNDVDLSLRAESDVLKAKSIFNERYEIRRPLHVGSTADVYEAQHTSANRIVALKILHRNSTSLESRKFRDEARVIASIAQDHVVTLYDQGMTADKQEYQVMECLHGETLRSILDREKRLTVQRTRSLLSQVCDAMTAFHELNIVHCEMHPSNLFVSRDANGAEKVTVLDFKNAREFVPDASRRAGLPPVIVGTSQYMSPEQSTGKNVDATADIYSIGCVMYECLTGRPPYEGSTVEELVMHHATHAPAPLQGAEFEGLQPILDKCLEKEPVLRFRDAAALKLALLGGSMYPARARDKEFGPGTIVGKYYDIIRELHVGRTSDVFEAQHLSFKKSVALKVSRKNPTQEMSKRFQWEAQVGAVLTSPNIVGIYDFGIDESGALFLVMDLLEGESLRSILDREKTLPLKRVRSLFSQVCDAMVVMHSKGVVHRELHPSNIFVSRSSDGEDKVVIIDFQNAHRKTAGSTRNLKASGEVIGTPQYMSPEQCFGQEVDSRADIYSVGCTIYECLIGKPPFVAKNLVDLMSMQVADKPAPLDDSKEFEGVQFVLDKCLAKEPDNRFADAAALKLALVGVEVQTKPSSKLRFPFFG